LQDELTPMSAPDDVRAWERPLRRVTWRAVIQIGLLVLATIAILRFVGNIEFDDVRDDLADADWAWVLLAFVVAQVPRLTQALSAKGSAVADIRYGPLYVLQLATSYLNLALPSGIARMAVFIRFFQRQGMHGAAAVTAGAIDSFAGNVLQAVLVAVLALITGADLLPELSAPTGDSRALLWIVIGLAVATVLVAGLVGRIRRSLVDRVRVWWPQVKTSLGALRRSNRLVLLIGGNLATELLFAIALGLMARAFGYHVALSELILINSGASLLSSFIPVPGGIGVVELSLEVGLISAGMAPAAATATILQYRLATFFLPPLWGSVAFRWLEQKGYL
jgi:glycosyltransferase 2 family protein